MALQQIRLNQIKADLPGFIDFEQQLIHIFGDSYVKKFIATQGQTVFNLDKEYRTGKNALRVFVNGQIYYEGVPNGWNEIDEMTMEFINPLSVGDIVVIVYNTLPWYSLKMSADRISNVFNVFRNSTEISYANNEQTIFDAPITFTRGVNQVSVYANGLLLINGAQYDYVELSNSQIKLNRTYPLGTQIIIEVVLGNLEIISRDRFSYIITENMLEQKVFTIPKSYKVGNNLIKVYRNGLLLTQGINHDYIETNENTITLNYTIPLNNTITFEIIDFTLEILKIVRDSLKVTDVNKNNVVFTVPPYIMGQKMLKVYRNGLLLVEGFNNDYVEITSTTFKYNIEPMLVGDLMEYEVITF